MEIMSQQTKIAQQRKTQWLYIGIGVCWRTFGMYFTLKNIRKNEKPWPPLLNWTPKPSKRIAVKEIHHRVKTI